MKQISLIACAFFIVSTIFAQENLLKDSKFEKASFDVSEVYREVHPKGEWYPCLFNDRSALISVVDDEEKGRAVRFQSLSGISYAYSYVAQRVEGTLKPGIYRVGLWAKSLLADPKPVLNVYLRINTPHQKFFFFKLDDFDPKVNPNRSGALFQKHITTEWRYYEIDFDLNKVINSGANYKLSTEKGNVITIEKSTKYDLSDFYIGISCTSKNSQFLFTDVTLTQIADKKRE